ncbi:MAG: ribosomal L7Ae/L30e/S12e/Gadd45 family protein [Oscillospiraceae bacterium]|nr:ribosomal L7Ae/L30e/S12e/Gadd45 family protein [Oscillospiraceae bacterium]
MLKELTAKKKVVGLKQTRRAVAEGLAERVYLALDADPLLTEPLVQLCREAGVCITEVRTMKELGRACAIAVGTAAAAIVAK